MFCPIESPQKSHLPAPSVTLRCWGTALRDRRRRASRWICWGKVGRKSTAVLAPMMMIYLIYPLGNIQKTMENSENHDFQ